MSTILGTFKHAAVYGIAAAAGRMVGILMLPFYAQSFRDQGYGVLGMIDAGLSFLMTLYGYSMVGAITRIFYEEEEANRSRVISTGFLLYGFTSLAIAGLLLPFAQPISSFMFGEPEYARYLQLALLAFCFDISGQAASSILVIRRRSVLFSGIGLFRLGLGLGLNVWLIVVSGWGLMGYFVSALVVAIVSSVIYHGIAIRECGLSFDRRIAQKLFAFQLPLVPGGIASFISRQVERVMLRAQVGLESVGVLEMGYKFPWIIGTLITEPFIKSWNTKRTEIAEEVLAPVTIGRVFTYYYFISTFAGLLLALNIQPLLEAITPQEFWLAHRIAQVEIVATILQGCEIHLSFGLYWSKDMKTYSKIRIAVALLKVALAYLFISSWGLYGAAFSALAVAAVRLVWVYLLSQKRYALKIEWVKVIGISAVAVSMFFILVNLNLREWPAYLWMEENVVNKCALIVGQTPFGKWKDGRIIELLMARSAPFTEILMRTALGSSFLVLIPLVRRGARRFIVFP